MDHVRTLFTAESAKRAAVAVQSRMAELGIEMKLGQAYEAVAAAAGYRNWATMKAAIEGAQRAKTEEASPGLVGALAAAARSGTLSATDAAVLASAASGDREAVSRLAAACGHVPVATIDVAAETERLGKVMQGSTDSIPSANAVRQLAEEFAAGCEAEHRMYADFFSDWLSELPTQNRTLSALRTG